MGRGPRDKDDPPMKRPFHPADGLEGEMGAGVAIAEEASYCSTRRELNFVADQARRPQVGTEIRLRLGDPVEVVGADGQVGRLEPQEGSSMRSCLMLGYRIAGSVTVFDPDLGRGTISVTGIRQGPSE
jgi:hypothetical protein